MEENENNPILVSSKPLKSEFSNRQTIIITSELFTLGRGLKNSICIPFLAISRNHCTFKKSNKHEWYVEDNSSLGIKVNNEKLGQGTKRKLEHEDLISLEPSDEFLYKFLLPSQDVFETPRKRIKVEDEVDSTMINNVRLKFEESQKCEMQHIEEKIQNAKQMQSTSITLKKQLQEDMNRQMQQLEKEFSVQMENLKGEKNEVEDQKALLIEERDAQLSNVKNEMDGKIAELMEQINRHNESESELINENNILKKKLRKEREDFLSELSRESSSKQDMLHTLEAKIQQQEEARLKERHELEETLRKETELLRLVKEKELKELEELKRQREVELQQELTNIKQNFAAQVELTEQQRIKAERDLREQMEQMKRQQADEQAKMAQFQKEREEIQLKLTEAQNDAEKSKVESQARVTERETELAALAAERIQKQVDQSSEVISTLQEQLEKVTNKLQTVESERNTILETIEDLGEGSSARATLNNFGQLMESELQCSVCAELFVEATTLNCSHTFCKYCIAMWKKNKRDCPICRAPISSECRSLVLDSFIDKMVENLTVEMKSKRLEILNHRAAEVQNSMKPARRTSSSRRRNTTGTRTIRTSRGGRGRTTEIITYGPPRTPVLRQTVDLTSLPIPMSPGVRPPVIPAALLPPQVGLVRGTPMTPRSVQTVDLTTPTGQTGSATIDLTSPPVATLARQPARVLIAVQIPTDQPARLLSVEAHQMATEARGAMVDLTGVPAAVPTAATDRALATVQKLTLYQRSTRQSSTAAGQMQTRTIHAADNQIPDRVRQLRAWIRLRMRGLTARGAPSLAGSPPAAPATAATQPTLQNQSRPGPTVDLTGVGPTAWTERSGRTTRTDALPTAAGATSANQEPARQFPREVLTVAIPMNPGERPPPGAPLRLLRWPTHLQTGTGRPVVVALAGGGSPASAAPTSAATDAASRAGVADTGLPAAPSGSLPPVPE